MKFTITRDMQAQRNKMSPSFEKKIQYTYILSSVTLHEKMHVQRNKISPSFEKIQYTTLGATIGTDLLTSTSAKP